MMCKSEYKLIRKMQWDGDVLKFQDTMHDVLREAKQAAEDAMTGEVLSHFECDFSDFREYLHDKIKWEQKQRAAMPRWIPVTERLPENFAEVLVTDGEDVGIAALQGFMDDEVVWCNAYGMDYINDPDDEDYLPITHWMPLPEPPKEENHGSM